jgi:hypothetical protein
VCKNEEAKLALPGGFSKLKGEKSAWKEKDPTGFLTHQQELAVRSPLLKRSPRALTHPPTRTHALASLAFALVLFLRPWSPSNVAL